MAESWQLIDKSVFKATYKGEEKGTYEQAATGRAHFYLEYDKNSLSPVSVTIRFRYEADTGLYDKFDILLAPYETSHKLLHVKTIAGSGSGRGPYYSPSFKLTKTYTAAYFTLPSFWICNLGSSRVYENPEDIETDYGYEKNSSAWLGQVMRTTIKATYHEIVPDTTVAKAGTVASSINITDNKNNTATVSGVLGKSDTNNGWEAATLTYNTYDTNNNRLSTGSFALTTGDGKSFNKTIKIPVNCTKIYAMVVCQYKWNTASDSFTKSSGIKYRFGSLPGKPKLSWTKSRLTNKEVLTYSWAQPTENTANYLPMSCLRGYRIRMRRDGAWIQIATVANGLSSSSQNNYDTWKYTEQTLMHGAEIKKGTTNTFTFDPAAFGYLPGNMIELDVWANYLDGNNESVWSGSTAGEFTASDVDTFQNAGVVHVKVPTASGGSKWVEGQVYVKANSKWVEAETINVKAGGIWKESE